MDSGGNHVGSPDCLPLGCSFTAPLEGGFRGAGLNSCPSGPVEASRREGWGFVTHCMCLGTTAAAAWGRAQPGYELWRLLWANRSSGAFLPAGMGQLPEGSGVAQSWLLCL